MAARIGINGFGRIGRLVFRAALQNKNVEVVAINDLFDAEYLAYMLKYDSTHGAFKGTIEVQGSDIIVQGKKIRMTAEKDMVNLKWNDIGADYVVESTGLFTTLDSAKGHLSAGAKKVVISAPSADAPMFVMGVNHKTYRKEMNIVSNASCTTNCLAPLAQALHRAVGIRQGLVNTIHAYTNDQNLLDKAHSDLYRARAAALSMIPTSTGAAKTIGLVLPELAGRLDGLSVRVPTPNVSLLDLTFTCERPSSREAINAALQQAAQQLPAGVMECSDLPLVSSDFNGHPLSCVVDLNHTRVQGDLVKVLAWYDNEWAFANRMLDVLLAWTHP